MNTAERIELTDLSKFAGNHYKDVQFLEEVHLGLPVVARADLPKLRLADDASVKCVREEVSKWNKLFRDQFPGAGYYAHSQEDEDLLNDNVFVLYADDVFHDAFVAGYGSEEVVVGLPK